MEFLIKSSQLLMSLSILVILHELGHFIPAKLFKTRVEKFYLFFDPWFSVLKIKIGETEYGVGWLPLGGYVKISGMIDESLDKEQMKKPAKKWEFRAKPTWQRLIIMLGGVTVNLFLGFFIYSMTLFVYGDKYLPNESLSDGVWCVSEMGGELGFENGDKFISADGEKIERFSDITAKILFSKSISVERDGVIKNIDMPSDVVEKLLKNDRKLIFSPRIPVIVSSVKENSNAFASGLKANDIILEVNGNKVRYFDQLRLLLENLREQQIDITVNRGGEYVSLKTVVDNNAKIGFLPANPSFEQLDKMGYYSLASHKYTFFESFPAGYKKGLKILSGYIDQFLLILNPSSKAYKGIGGFGSIGSMFPAEWNWQVFWNLTAFLSLILAFMNILPIPALDGGHVMFLIYEMIVGKPAPEKVVEYAQAIGMIILLSLLVYANGLDLARFF